MNKKHCVLFVLPYLKGGGVERVFINLANSFSKNGLRVHFLVGGGLREFKSEFVKDVSLVDLNNKNVRKKGVFILSDFYKVVKYIKSIEPHYVISATTPANLLLLLASYFVKQPGLVITTHVDLLASRKYLLSPLQRVLLSFALRLYGRADYLIANSIGTKDSIIKLTKLSDSRVIKIGNPIISEDFYADLGGEAVHSWFADDSGIPVLVGMGRLSEQKDFATLLYAVREVQKVRAVRLIIVGEGPLRKSLETLISELNLSECVDMVGFKEKPLQYIERCDLFVLSSIVEGFGNVIVEALALGKTIVSTDCPSGPSEILQGGKYGYLVPVSDPQALAVMIDKALDSQYEPDVLMSYATSNYSVSCIADKYQNALNLLQG